MKPTPKTGFFLLAFFLLASTVFALDIQSPERVPGFSPFTFRATLPATNMFTQATVQFDGINIATVYPAGTCQIQPDWIPFLIHCATFDADTETNEGLTTVITHTGFANGSHTITVSSQGPQSETKTVNVHVFDALDAQIKAGIDTQLAAVQMDVNTLQTQTTTNTEDVYAAKTEIETAKNETNAKVEELSAKISTLEQRDAQLTAEREAQAKQGFQIPFLSSPGTGFAGGANAPFLGIAILAVGAFIAFFFIRGRKNGRGFGVGGGMNKSTPFFEGNMDALFKGLPGGNTEANSSPQPHKWSTEGEKGLREDVETNPPEKINFGDLIQKERD